MEDRPDFGKKRTDVVLGNDILGRLDDASNEDLSIFATPVLEAKDRSRPRPSKQEQLEIDYTRLASRNPGMVMVQAAKEHDDKMIRFAASKGEVFPVEIDPILTVAGGVCIDDIDHAHHQSGRGVSKTLDALKSSGIDLNDVRDGEPAAHRVTRFYGERILGAYYNTSYAALIGMTDDSHEERLAAFAQNGVDFSVTNAAGDKPKDILREMARIAAKENREDPAKAVSHVEYKFESVEQAARIYRIEQVAQDKAQSASSPKVDRPGKVQDER